MELSVFSSSHSHSQPVTTATCCYVTNNNNLLLIFFLPREYLPRVKKVKKNNNNNYIIWRLIKQAQVPSTKEPLGLTTRDNRRPDSVTLLPWSIGKPIAWDVTIPDTFADSHINATSTQARRVYPNIAVNSKTAKYVDLTATHVFMTIANETAGSWNQRANDDTEDICRCISIITEEPLQSIHLFQCISGAIQHGNTVSFTSMFGDD